MIGAGIAYFAIVFAIGFVLGTIRTLWLAPAVGPTSAVLVELPLILTVSAVAARWIVQRWQLATSGAAFGAGAVAFALLMAAEAGLAVFAFGIGLSAWAASLATVPGVIGLAGQLGFALMPLLWWGPERGTR